ncbi:MAG: phosphohydrolase [Muribaculaceae bacterium]|nr:phosphohydrolase [Muribaculaceae bacterium]
MLNLDIPDNDSVGSLIDRYYPSGEALREILLTHSHCVAEKALRLADDYVMKHPEAPRPDRQFIAEAAMLHDIGIQSCDAPGIYCYGTLPYICHGVEGSRILAEDGLLRHALVCERHTGSGLSAEEIEEEALPLPARDMLPVSIEEKIICYADKFFSKNPESLTEEKDLSSVRKSISKFGTAPLQRLDDLTALF